MKQKYKVGITAAVITFVAVSGIALLGGNSGPEVPNEVSEYEELGNNFGNDIKQYDNAQLAMRANGSNVTLVAFKYTSTATTEATLERELNNIGRAYLKNVNNTDVTHPPTLSVKASNVKATLPHPSVAAYTEGRLNMDATLKTMEVTGIERE